MASSWDEGIDPAGTNELFFGHAVPPQHLADPAARRDNAVDLARQLREAAVAGADQRGKAQRGKGAAGKPRPTQGIADRLRRARDRTAQERRHAVLRQSASGAAVSVELAIAGRTAHPHHRAARAADRRRVIGQHDLPPDRVRRIDEPYGNGGGAGVQMDDPRPQARDQGARTTRAALGSGAP